MAAVTLVIAIVLSLTFGIALGYFAAIGILRAFGHRPQKRAAAALTTVESSGD
ncbi:MAG: hypothetical protein ACE14M_14125 [Terriglobales bacterium]